jgi:hypothetical protein
MDMTLEGGELLVLQNLLDLQGDSRDYIEDSRLATATKMEVQDVRNWLEILEGRGFVESTRLTEEVSAYVTAKGKLAVRPKPPISAPKTVGETTSATQPTPKFVPSLTMRTTLLWRNLTKTQLAILLLLIGIVDFYTGVPRHTILYVYHCVVNDQRPWNPDHPVPHPASHMPLSPSMTR